MNKSQAFFLYLEKRKKQFNKRIDKELARKLSAGEIEDSPHARSIVFLELMNIPQWEKAAFFAGWKEREKELDKRIEIGGVSYTRKQLQAIFKEVREKRIDLEGN